MKNSYKKNILYVENINELSKDLIELFKTLSNKLHIANNGLDGFKIFENNKNDIDLVITNTTLDKINGFEMIQMINDLSQDPKIIFLSNNKDSESLLKAIELGSDDYLLKPIQLSKILSSINKISDGLNVRMFVRQQMNTLKHLEESLNLNNIIFYMDKNFNILNGNNNFMLRFGDSIGKNIESLLVNQEDKHGIKNISDMDLYNRYYNQKIKFNLGENKLVLNTKIITDLDVHGAFLKYICIQEDITKEYAVDKDIQKSLLDKNFKLIQDNKAKELEINKLKDSVAILKAENDTPYTHHERMLRLKKKLEDREAHNIQKLKNRIHEIELKSTEYNFEIDRLRKENSSFRRRDEEFRDFDNLKKELEFYKQLDKNNTDSLIKLRRDLKKEKQKTFMDRILHK